MNIDPGLILLAFLFMGLLALFTVPLAAAAFFAGVLLLWMNPAPLPEGFLLNYSLSMRLNSPALISIPLAALAGELAVAAGITDRLLDVADAMAGNTRHAVAARSILGCTLFATVSGVGPAAVTAEGKRLIPDMLRAGYPREAAAGAIASAAGLSIIIPASIPLTIYAAAASLQTNIVFTASFLPGLLVAALLLASLLLYARFRRCRDLRAPRRTGAGLRAVRDGKWALLLPLLVLSALFTGFLTAPEAAAFSSAYAAMIGAFVHRRLGLAEIRVALVRAATTAAPVLLLAGIGGLFAMLMDACGFSQRLAESLYAAAGGRIGAIALMNLALLAAGCLLDMPAIISLLVPLLLPLAARCGMSPPHFGVMVVVNIAIGLITPPQAYNIAAAADLAGIGMGRAAGGAWPCLLALLAGLAAVSLFPELSLWLPRVFGWPV